MVTVDGVAVVDVSANETDGCSSAHELVVFAEEGKTDLRALHVVIEVNFVAIKDGEDPVRREGSDEWSGHG